jgi:hypothetical protein
MYVKIVYMFCQKNITHVLVQDIKAVFSCKTIVVFKLKEELYRQCLTIMAMFCHCHQR